MCFGVKGNSFGSFFFFKIGRLVVIKLVYFYGYVFCDVGFVLYWSFWGCGENLWNGINKLVNIFIIFVFNYIFILEGKLDMNVYGLKWFKIFGYNLEFFEIVFLVFNLYWMVLR